jgi:hypothetical protein
VLLSHHLAWHGVRGYKLKVESFPGAHPGASNLQLVTLQHATAELALPARFPPASFRLEDGCLVGSTTAAILKMVSAAGIAPAIPRSQAECVADSLRADDSGRLILKFVGVATPKTLAVGIAVRFGTGGLEGIGLPKSSREQRALCSLNYESEEN